MGSTAAVMQLVGAGAGAVNTGVSSYNQGNAALLQGRSSRSMANVNASMMDMEAADATRRGQVMAQRQGLRTSLLIGRQRATAAAQGVDVNSGSALDLQAQAARMGVVDQHTIRMNAYKEAMGIKMGASNQRYQGEMNYIGARGRYSNTLLAGGMNATGQVYNGLNNYYKYRPPLSMSDGYDGEYLAENGAGD